MADIKTKEKYTAIKTLDPALVRSRLLMKAKAKKEGRYDGAEDEQQSSVTDYAVGKAVTAAEDSVFVAAEKGNYLRKTIKIKMTDGRVAEVLPNRAEQFAKGTEAHSQSAKKKFASDKLARSKTIISQRALRKKKKSINSAKRMSVAMASVLSISWVTCLIIIMIFSVIGASIYMLAPETEENEELREYMDEEFSEYLAEHGGLFELPVRGMTRAHVSSPFGRRESPDGIGSVKHKGIDIAFPEGTPVVASELGIVSFSGENGDFGICVIIDHGYGIETVYAHLNTAYVLPGEKVARGEVIGEVGNTGVSTGPHLHFEVKVDGNQINPERGYLGIPKAS